MPNECRVRHWSPECDGDGACSWPGPIRTDLGSTDQREGAAEGARKARRMVPKPRPPIGARVFPAFRSDRRLVGVSYGVALARRTVEVTTVDARPA